MNDNCSVNTEPDIGKPASGGHIFLIGFMGAGKSTVARQLKRQKGLDIVEMDQIIAQEQKMSCPQIVEKFGEEHFRKLETDLLLSLSSEKPKVVSCGGGVAMRPENVKAMKDCGTVILLKAMPSTILERVKDSHERPLLENNKTVEHIEKLMAARKGAYEAAADYQVSTDGKSSEQIAQKIDSLLAADCEKKRLKHV